MGRYQGWEMSPGRGEATEGENGRSRWDWMTLKRLPPKKILRNELETDYSSRGTNCLTSIRVLAVLERTCRHCRGTRYKENYRDDYNQQGIQYLTFRCSRGKQGLWEKNAPVFHQWPGRAPVLHGWESPRATVEPLRSLGQLVNVIVQATIRVSWPAMQSFALSQ